MVRVAVVDGRTASLQPPADAVELDDDAFPSLHTGELERGEGGARVAAVVLAGDGELQVDRLEAPGAHHLRDVCEPRVEQVRDLGDGRGCRVVVEVDVEKNG